MANPLQRLAPCPLPLPLDLSLPRRVLVLAPHADDETIGCGGTLALLRERGCEVVVVIVTDGAGGDPAGRAGGDIVAVRRQEATAATAALGVERVLFWDEPDGSVGDTAALRSNVAALLAAERPDWVLLPSLLDYHRDHVAVALAVLAGVRRSGVRLRCLMYETWSPLPASHCVDISAVIARKQAALSAYASQLSYNDYRSAAMGLNAYRALYCNPDSGASHAECFLEIAPRRWLAGRERSLLRVRLALERLLRSGS